MDSVSGVSAICDVGDRSRLGGDQWSAPLGVDVDAVVRGGTAVPSPAEQTDPWVASIGPDPPPGPVLRSWIDTGASSSGVLSPSFRIVEVERLVLDIGIEVPPIARRGGARVALEGDLARALASWLHAADHFDAFPRSVKRSILERIVRAKRPEARAKRIGEMARLAEDNVRANQWRR
ncbi:MAG: YdeI/OmpD-associated family protein [Acidobacteria bacterium]|nr:YdeI/OmpD-associated family protein [Acidobacteriota bacterium]